MNPPSASPKTLTPDSDSPKVLGVRTSPLSRTTTSLLAIGCVAAVAMSGWWALAVPLRTPPTDTNEGGTKSASLSKRDSMDGRDAVAIDLAAFRTPLWVAPPAPPAPPPTPPTPAKSVPEPPPPPMKWQLLAIIGERTSEASSQPRAMLYDPDADTIIELSKGQQNAGRTVMSISGGRIVIRQGKHTHTLCLDPLRTTWSEGAP